jgi:hypothetical protein
MAEKTAKNSKKKENFFKWLKALCGVGFRPISARISA